MTTQHKTQIGSAITVARSSYFLGGEHRQVLVNGVRRLSIIPQPSALGIHSNMFEIAILDGANLEVVEAFCTEERIAQIVGEMVLNGQL